MLRVLSWNVWWRFGPWEARQPAIAATLAASGADLIGLQEVSAEDGGHNQAEELAAGLGYHLAQTELRYFNGMAFTNAVLSRWPIAERHVETLPNAAGAPSHRQVVAASVDSPHGPLLFVTTHLDWHFDASATRQAQVGALCRLVAARRPDPTTGYPAILTGDLNATPHSDEVRSLTGARPVPEPGLTFVDAWEVAGEGPGHTWNGANPYLADATYPNRRLDYVLLSWPRAKPLGTVDGVRLFGHEPVDGVIASDHYAVVADLRT